MVARIPRLGGKCEVDSSPGNGSRVKVLFSQEALVEEAAAVGMEMDFTLAIYGSSLPANSSPSSSHA